MPYLDRDTGPRRAAETRERILDAALECFAARGYEGTSMRQLAESCGLTDAALYYHFESKAALMRALLSERWGSIAAPEQPLAARTPHAALHQVVDLIVDRWCEHAAFLRVLAREAHTSEFARDLYARAADDWRDHIGRTMGAEITAGLRDQTALSVQFVLIGLLFTGLQEHGERFADVAADPAFRERVHARVGTVAPAAGLFATGTLA